MTEFRLFCTVLFVTMGALAAGSNRTDWDFSEAGIVMLGLSVASVTVSFFGERCRTNQENPK